MVAVFRHVPPRPPRQSGKLHPSVLNVASAVSGAGAASGFGTASGVGAKNIAAVGNASGVGTAIGRAVSASVGAASAVGSANAMAAFGPGISVGSSVGHGVATGGGSRVSSGVGSAAGVGAGLANTSGLVIRPMAGSASGSASVIGRSTGNTASSVGSAHGGLFISNAVSASFNSTVQHGSGRVSRNEDGTPVLTGEFVGPTPIAEHDVYMGIAKATGVSFFAVEIEAFLPGSSTSTVVVANGWNVTARNTLNIEPSAVFESTATIFASDLGYVTRADDSDGIIPYPPFVSEAFAIDRGIALEPQAAAVAWGYGQISLANQSGYFDAVAASWNVDGRDVAIYRGTKTWDDIRGIWIDPPRPTLISMFTGLATPWFLDTDNLTIPLRDATYWIEKPYLTDQYAGTGTYDGTSSLTGVLKPVARGGTSANPIRNVTPVLVDPVALIYQFNNAAGTVVNLYEGAAKTITFLADTTNLYQGTTLAGRYRTDVSRGLFQLGSVPVHAITCDVTGTFPGGSTTSTTASVVLAMLQTDMQVPAGNIDVASFTNAAAANPYTVGVYFSSSDNPDGVTAVSEVLESFGAKLIIDRVGKLSCFVLRGLIGNEVPQGFINTTNCVSVTPIRLSNAIDPPPYRLRLAYAHNYTVQTTDLNSASATSTQLQFVKTPDNFALWQSNDVLERYRRPNDPAPFGGAMLVQSQAALVVAALGQLWGGRSRLYECVLPVAIGLSFDLGDVVKITYPMDDLYNGPLGQVVGERFQSSDSTVTIRVLVTAPFVDTSGGGPVDPPGPVLPGVPTGLSVADITTPVPGVPPNAPINVVANG